METETTARTRSLQKRELKPLLVKQLKQEQPDFRFLTFATSVYYFQRTRDFRDYDLKEMLHIVYSFSEHTMQASVSSRLNPVHTLNPIYNSGLINPHVDLVSLKNDATEYRCDGSMDGAREMVKTAINDFRNVAISYLDQRFYNLHTSRMINAGLDMIEQWDFDKTMLGNELQVQIRKAKFNLARIRQPQLNELREHLESVARRTHEELLEVPRLAFDLVELYCNRRIAGY